MQPYHAIDDGRWAERVIGPTRIETTYAFRSLLDAGARLAFGSDWFVAPPTPLEGIYAAVTRRTLDGATSRRLGAGAEDHRRGGAARLHRRARRTRHSSEADKGMLAAGTLADFVVIDRDLFAIPPASCARSRSR